MYPLVLGIVVFQSVRHGFSPCVVALKRVEQDLAKRLLGYFLVFCFVIYPNIKKRKLVVRWSDNLIFAVVVYMKTRKDLDDQNVESCYSLGIFFGRPLCFNGHKPIKFYIVRSRHVIFISIKASGSSFATFVNNARICQPRCRLMVQTPPFSASSLLWVSPHQTPPKLKTSLLPLDSHLLNSTEQHGNHKNHPARGGQR